MLVSSEDMDRTAGEVRPTTSSLYVRSSLLLKAARGRLISWLKPIINALLKEGALLAPLKEAIIKPLLKKTYIGPQRSG